MTSTTCGELILAEFHSLDFLLFSKEVYSGNTILEAFFQNYLPLLGLTVLTACLFCFSSATPSENLVNVMHCDCHVQHCNVLMPASGFPASSRCCSPLLKTLQSSKEEIQ